MPNVMPRSVSFLQRAALLESDIKHERSNSSQYAAVENYLAPKISNCGFTQIHFKDTLYSVSVYPFTL